MGLVWTARFVALLHVTFAAKLQLSLPEKLYVTEGASLTMNCSFSPPPTDLNYIIVKWSMMPTYYSENMSMHDITKIYNSGIEIASTGVATFVGNVEKGDCSLRLLYVSSSLHPVFRCQVICGRCNTENNLVEGEVMLNVTAAAPQPRGGDVSNVTFELEAVTSNASLFSSTKRTGLVAAVVAVAAVAVLGLVAAATVKFQHRSQGALRVHTGSDDAADDRHHEDRTAGPDVNISSV
ncbi:uncharacterized protein LOC133339624 isoform X2 [Lethenteron reissneri]|nr:uncharacterized protein LOC133339624 isoform X2 [Lethenteron reissneri]XP_061403745.1 uncharacterized protein LOC133339624 isoform X2 [Lethenteron reissneri]